MDFNKARTFIEVVDSGGITAAATQMLRTQQAISLQIQQFEKEVGLSLFDRQGPKIVLTRDGEKIYKELRPKLLDMENAIMALKSSKKQASGVLRIGAWMEQTIHYLPRIVKLFQQQYPCVEFELRLSDDTGIERMLSSNEIDFGIQVYCTDNKLFTKEPIYRQTLLPVASRNYIEKHPTPTTVEDTLEYSLLDYNDDYSAYNQWIKVNQRELLPQARKKPRSVKISNSIALKEFVKQGLGFGFLHHELIEDELQSGALQLLLPRCKYSDIYVELDVVRKRKHTLNYIQTEFLSLLKEQRKYWLSR